MSPLLTVFVSLLSLVLLYYGGDWLVRGASVIARKLGLSQLAVGLTVVAFGTSLPELVVSLRAAVSGAEAVAVGNVVGSNIANIALILGLTAILRSASVQSRLLRFDMPLLVICSLALVWVLSDGRCSRWEGALFLGGLVVYTGFTFWESRRESESVKEEFASAAPERDETLVRCVSRVVLGLALLVTGGHLFVGSAVKLAILMKISQGTIGLTIVAVGTSLPELVTSVVASRRGHGDIAIGNVVGSNLFNILGILGVTALVRPLDGSAMTLVDLWTMVGLAVLLSVFMWTRRTLDRLEGVVLCTLYIAYSAWLIWT